MRFAEKVIRVRSETKQRWDRYVKQGMTADRALNELLDRIGAK